MTFLRKCNECGLEAHTQEDLEKFVKDKQSKHQRQNRCKNCIRPYSKEKKNKRVNEKNRERKQKGILYKGGKCEACGIKYDGTNAIIFDFHHLDPTQKEFNPRQVKAYSWEKFKTEIDKCALLCSNCHRLAHKKGDY